MIRRHARCGPPCCPCFSTVVQTKSVRATLTKCGLGDFGPLDAEGDPVSGYNPDRRWLHEHKELHSTGPGEHFIDVEGVPTLVPCDVFEHDVTDAVYDPTKDGCSAENDDSYEASEGCTATGCGEGWEVSPMAVTTSTRSQSGSGGTEGCTYTFDQVRDTEYTTALLGTHVSTLLAGVDLSELEWSSGVTAFFDEDGEIQFVDTGGEILISYYIPLEDDELTITKAMGAYRIQAFHGDWCPGDGAIKVRWREIFIPQTRDISGTVIDGTPEYTDFEEEIPEADILDNIALGQNWSATEEYSAPEQTTFGYKFVGGPQIRGEAGIWDFQTQGAFLQKRGFPQYNDVSTPPKIYKRETASGSYAGCPAQSLPAKTYSGYRRVFEDEINPDFTDPTGSGETTFSADVPSSYKTPIFPDAGVGVFNPPPPSSSTATTREWLTAPLCGATPVEDQLIMTLSDEVTTAAIQGPVDGIIAEDWGEVEGPLPLPTGVNSIQFLSADETYYARQKCRFKLSGQIIAIFVDPVDFTFVYTLVEKNLITGEIGRTNVDTELHFEPGEFIGVSDWITLPDELGKHYWIEIDPGLQPTDLTFGTFPGVEACPTRLPVLIHPAPEPV